MRNEMLIARTNEFLFFKVSKKECFPQFINRKISDSICRGKIASIKLFFHYQVARIFYKIKNLQAIVLKLFTLKVNAC